jgi:hypothetical protein
MRGGEGDGLDDVESCEEDELGFVVYTHSFDVGFEDFENLFSVLLSFMKMS